MADLAISIAGTLIQVIASEAIQKICSMWGYKDELEDLSKTIITIKNVLLDAESKRDLSTVQQGYIAELKDAVYDADDLFDEFRTLVQLNQIGGDRGGKLSGKVRRFFSSKKGKLSMAHRMSSRVKEIKGNLDGIANNYTRFGFSVDYKPIVRRREDSCSYVDAKDIIGRHKDKDVIIDMLLAPNGDHEDFRFLTIVGVGGLGKTALAQLVFNDEKVENEFSSSRLWVCVSDQDGAQFDVKTILSKILEVATKKMQDNTSSMELVQQQFREYFNGKKYFLVLDDVWTENRGNWVNLKKFLMMGAKGSKIVVTSRSENTGNIIESKHVYKLKGLSKEDSQCLFEKSAFEGGEKHLELVKIGESIARKCCGIPLAIKVIGSLLFGQDITKWQSIERSGLVDIGLGDSEKILPILKLSYYNLAPSLKSCFSYCAVYPKDYRMYKGNLIDLWMAQGYIVPLDGGQCVEDAAEEHFSILMRRCFFQDIKKDKYGNVEFVKIHDLMHDVAQEVGKDEICVVTSKTSKLGEKARHVNIVENCAQSSVGSSKIRSYICNGWEKHLLDKAILNLTALRMLDLSYIGIESLPETIDSLMLLRYLNLRGNINFKSLHDSITKLYNLQTLVLRDCKSLREVPKDFSNLINLRHLDLHGCNKLNGMPSGILKLSNLRVLPYYVASSDISNEELKVLQQVFAKVKGKMCINTGRRDSKSLKFMVNLTMSLIFSWVIPEDVVEKLELPPYLNELGLYSYNVKRVPWQTISLPQHLIRIEIMKCKKLEQIPVLSKLPNLKSLKIEVLDSVEYMEKRMSSNNNDIKVVTDFFPSLESLVVVGMKKLKGWWMEGIPQVRLRFLRLSHLKIEKCPNFKSFAPCSNSENLLQLELPGLCTLDINNCSNLALDLICPPTLEMLALKGTNESLLITSELGKLREMEIDKVEYLKLLPTTNCLSSLTILNSKKLRRLPRLDHLIALEQLSLSGNTEFSICEEDNEEPWEALPQSLRELKFCSLPKMKSLPKGMQHLTSLQSLELKFLHNVEVGPPERMSCLSSLQSLSMWDCQGIKSLPEAIKDLSSLKSLHIYDCPSIKSFPEAIKDLTTLEELYIRFCPELTERCKKPNGEDFSKIQHIPHIIIF